MKGVVYTGERQCEVREVPAPRPGYDEVLIRVMAAGICGSDLHVYRSADRSDQVRGHEACGVVEESGPGVIRLKAGDRVAVHHHFGCGVCAECARGETVACSVRHYVVGGNVSGAFAEYLTAPERNCILLPSGAGYEDGAFMACVGGTAFGALRRLGAKAHDCLAVLGLGPVGLSCLLVAKALGLRVIGVDLAPVRVELARQCGADAAVLSSDNDPVEAIHAFSRTGDLSERTGADFVIEASGSAAARSIILPALRREGKAAILGVGSDEKVINPSDIHGKAATLIGSVVFPLGWMWDLARFMETSGLKFEPAVTHRFPLENAADALLAADETKGGKVIIEPQEEPS